MIKIKNQRFFILIETINTKQYKKIFYNKTANRKYNIETIHKKKQSFFLFLSKQ